MFWVPIFFLFCDWNPFKCPLRVFFSLMRWKLSLIFSANYSYWLLTSIQYFLILSHLTFFSSSLCWIRNHTKLFYREVLLWSMPPDLYLIQFLQLPINENNWVDIRCWTNRFMIPECTDIESVSFFEVAYEIFIRLRFHEFFSVNSINLSQISTFKNKLLRSTLRMYLTNFFVVSFWGSLVWDQWTSFGS